jgi:Ras family
MRGDKSKETVAYKEGNSTAVWIGAHKYIECSALTGLNVKEVFVEAIKAGMSTKTGENGKQCSLM